LLECLHNTPQGNAELYVMCKPSTCVEASHDRVQVPFNVKPIEGVQMWWRCKRSKFRKGDISDLEVQMIQIRRRKSSACLQTKQKKTNKETKKEWKEEMTFQAYLLVHVFEREHVHALWHVHRVQQP